MFMQYFLGYSSFTNESIFSPTLFVEIRKRLNQTIVNSICELVVSHQKEIESKRTKQEGSPAWMLLQRSLEQEVGQLLQ